MTTLIIMLDTWDYKFQTLKVEGDYSKFHNALIGSDSVTDEYLNMFYDKETGEPLHEWNKTSPQEDIEKKDYDKVALVIYLA